uniref:Uncharacterized protein n=1 Tax=Ralstonia solanacearum TaxID=305 RepID=A0A0S4UR91_RALSL|nr:protein of unknown function [Ralstonia solanacearum]CUV24715.1 protein of unknown function [Ralstonia solanacearum]CUV32662.1 protein of unknown function [Ralstonia solanacearum]CUV41080.1 protein of unknown function [Ralstonia solanacearum]CUV45422.1 protein of unknown function [Ralstonia solanacearum]
MSPHHDLYGLSHSSTPWVEATHSISRLVKKTL